MGELLLFPSWRVVTRDEGSAPGEPRVLIDPAGRRHDVEKVVRRRLVASSDPAEPLRHEAVVRAAGRTYRLTWREGADTWVVRPA